MFFVNTNNCSIKTLKKAGKRLAIVDPRHRPLRSDPGICLGYLLDEDSHSLNQTIYAKDSFDCLLLSVSNCQKRSLLLGFKYFLYCEGQLNAIKINDCEIHFRHFFCFYLQLNFQNKHKIQVAFLWWRKRYNILVYANKLVSLFLLIILIV